MDVLYLSTACTEKEYSNLNKNINQLKGQQAVKFNRLFAEGLAKNDVNVTMLSSRPVSPNIHPRKLYKSKIEREGDVKYVYPSFYNIKYVRQFMLMLGCYKYIVGWCKKHPEGFIFCDILNYTLLKVASDVIKHKNNKLIAVVTDLPELSGECKLNKRVLKQKKIISKSDFFVLLAEPMNEKINPYLKPHIVIEGFCDINMKDVLHDFVDKYSKKVVLYAGTIYKEYGVENLVKAFKKVNRADTELHIYGVGDFENELKQICKENDNIKYFGARPNDDVVKDELRATLLVNPRPTDEEFVKYSFPSKNMEYIASGTPLLTTNLPSMPSEYEKYCFITNDYSVEGLSEALEKVLDICSADLYKKGLRAKEWAMNCKNNIVQTKKVIDLIL